MKPWIFLDLFLGGPLGHAQLVQPHTMHAGLVVSYHRKFQQYSQSIQKKMHKRNGNITRRLVG